jgi:hypothetical protein
MFEKSTLLSIMFSSGAVATSSIPATVCAYAPNIISEVKGASQRQQNMVLG